MNALTDPDLWRDRLVEYGFSDDGEQLVGPVEWEAPDVAVRALVSVTLTDDFPFQPPRVRIRDAGIALTGLFHQERDGTLCLWEDQHSVDHAPWLDPGALLDRIADWLAKTAAGWPGDDSLDLERYLVSQDEFVLYNSDLMPLNQPLQVDRSSGDVIRISGRLSKARNREQRRRGGSLHAAWAVDLGTLRHPIWDWDDIAERLGESSGDLMRRIRAGEIDYLLLRYEHGATAVLVVRVASDQQGVTVKACESADDSIETRQLRAGSAAASLARASVAVVGCGAIGSFAADQLVRSGVRQLTLIDPERLRPGNVVRHLAGYSHTGELKVVAVSALLRDLAPDVQISTNASVRTLEQAQQLLNNHDIVLDATGSARASSLLGIAVQLPDTEPDRLLVSVCVQRAGTVSRIDRFPLRPGEEHLPALPHREDPAPPLHEAGCGSPVSPTPPTAVIAAAAEACRVAIDQYTGARRLPATVISAFEDLA